MIRFIIECHNVDLNVGLNRKDYVTMDFKLPALEEVLSKGGQGEMGFASYTLVGTEIIDD